MTEKVLNMYEIIASIQDEIGNIKKDSKNPHFGNTYATYEQVLEVLTPIFRKHGLVAYHTFVTNEKQNVVAIKTIIRSMKDNAKLQSVLEMPLVKSDPQAAGSAITYGKRYALLAMIGLGTEDDDAESAMPRKAVPNYPPEPGHEGARVTPENDVMERYMAGGQKCRKCGSKIVKNPKTGKWFCENKCWLEGN